jgi:molybdate transport system ATP-binding protein
VKCAHAFPSGFQLDVEFATDAATTSLFGPSGSGKSSLLAVIAGLLRPAQGHVAFDGEVWLDSSRSLWVAPEERRVGMVFQEPLLFPHLTVEGNLRYGLRRRREDGPGGIELGRVVEVLELGDMLARSPRTLSGGERQRVGLGRALLRSPRLLLLDEPLVALDELLKQRILAYLDRVLAEWRIPTVYVSHSQAEVRRLAHWVVALRVGRVIDSGPPDEVLGRLLGTDLDGAQGPTNLIRVEAIEHPADGGCRGRLAGQVVHLPETDEPVPAAGPCYVQFPPQAVTLSIEPVSEGLSARNRLTGTVHRLINHAGRVLVVVDVGLPIWAEVTPDAVTSLGLRAGLPVTCLIKTTAMQIIP